MVVSGDGSMLAGASAVHTYTLLAESGETGEIQTRTDLVALVAIAIDCRLPPQRETKFVIIVTSMAAYT